VGFPAQDEDVLATPVRALNGSNPGFLRSDSTLSITAITDSDNGTSTVPMLAAQLQRARGNFNIIGAFTGGSCVEDVSGIGDNNLMLGLLGGVSQEICDADWDPTFTAVVDHAHASAADFVLRGDPSGPVTVEVDGLVVLPTSGNVTVWSVDPATRRLTFNPAFRPGPGSVVRVTYSVACN
jgi:hypothetical protein